MTAHTPAQLHFLHRFDADQLRQARTFPRGAGRQICRCSVMPAAVSIHAPAADTLSQLATPGGLRATLHPAGLGRPAQLLEMLDT